MPNTFIKIASATVGSGGSASISFSSIPSGFTDLCIKVSARGAGSNVGLVTQFNGDTGANYNWLRIYGDGFNVNNQKGSTLGPPYTSFVLATNITPSTYTANAFGNAEIYIPNYGSSNFKTTSSEGVVENNATLGELYLTAGIWNNTSEITSISFSVDGGGSFAQYSTINLYGISKS